MITSRVLTKHFWKHDVLEELEKIRIELRQMETSVQMGSRMHYESTGKT